MSKENRASEVVSNSGVSCPCNFVNFQKSISQNELQINMGALVSYLPWKNEVPRDQTNNMFGSREEWIIRSELTL